MLLSFPEFTFMDLFWLAVALRFSQCLAWLEKIGTGLLAAWADNKEKGNKSVLHCFSQL